MKVWGVPVVATNLLPTNLGAGSDKSVALLLNRNAAIIGDRRIFTIKSSDEVLIRSDQSRKNPIRIKGRNSLVYKKCRKCGVGKGGFRNDIGHYVRSSWEANYARICKLLCKDYIYEKTTFILTKKDGSKVTYTPDFFHKRIVELKGFWRNNDKEKIELFKKQYPEEAKKLIVIEVKQYNRLEKRFRDRISNWE